MKKFKCSICSGSSFRIQNDKGSLECEGCKSVDELIEKHRITEVLYAGEQTIVEWDELEVNSTDYTRYMIIGRL